MLRIQKSLRDHSNNQNIKNEGEMKIVVKEVLNIIELNFLCSQNVPHVGVTVCLLSRLNCRHFNAPDTTLLYKVVFYTKSSTLRNILDFVRYTTSPLNMIQILDTT